MFSSSMGRIESKDGVFLEGFSYGMIILRERLRLKLVVATLSSSTGTWGLN
jgi:hypothetical protein